jgi:phage-related protein
MAVKPVRWLGDSRKVLKSLPAPVRHRAGIELFAVQLGANPSDWKIMHSVGPGALEMRIHVQNEYRVVYVAKFEEAVYVLHAFTKKSEQTSLRDVSLARHRYREMMLIRAAQ